VYVSPGKLGFQFAIKIADQRGRGIAKLLYQHLEKKCKEENVKEIMCDVYVINRTSMMFHEKIGFVPQLCIYSKKLE
jgi:L-amino acid N-acyltransferase YncA